MATTSIPDFLSVDGWDGMHAIFDLIKATKGQFTADEAMDFFKKWKNPDSPRGPIMIDPETRDIIQNIYMRRVEKVDGKLANVEIRDDPDGQGPVEGAEPGEVSAGLRRQAAYSARASFETPHAGSSAIDGFLSHAVINLSSS